MGHPGTYRELDGSAMPYAAAVDAWSRAALPVLLDTARAYNAMITYKELGEAVQQHRRMRVTPLHSDP